MIVLVTLVYTTSRVRDPRTCSELCLTLFRYKLIPESELSKLQVTIAG